MAGRLRRTFDTRLVVVLGALTCSLSLGGCDATFGDDPLEPESGSRISDLEFLDTDEDGESDAIDIDRDGKPDFYLDDDLDDVIDKLRAYDPEVCPVVDALLDRNQDDIPDALDLDCDGTADIELRPIADEQPGGDGPIGNNVCRVAQASNGVAQEVSCVSLDGVTHNCICRVDNTEISTCESNSSSPCSIPGNCCGF